MEKQRFVRLTSLWYMVLMCGHGLGIWFKPKDLPKSLKTVPFSVPKLPYVVTYLGLPIKWTIPLGQNGEYDFTGRVYLRKFDGTLSAKSTPLLNVSIVKTTSLEGELTCALVRVQASPWNGELLSFSITATSVLTKQGVTTEVKVHLVNVTGNLPNFPDALYSATYRKGQSQVITMKASPENSSVVYTLDSAPDENFQINSSTGSVTVDPDNMKPGVYFVLVYATTTELPELTDYTALRVNIVPIEEQKTEAETDDNSESQSADNSESQSSETDEGFGIPRPRTGCPDIDEFTEGNITLSGGTLKLTDTSISSGPWHIDVCMYSGRVFDVWPEGNYCLFGSPETDCPSEMSSRVVKFTSNKLLLWREHRCCRRSIDDVPQITWPEWGGNFHLLPASTDKCQKIESYEETLEVGQFSANDGPLEIITKDGNLTSSLVQPDGAIEIHFCAYRNVTSERKNDDGNPETDLTLVYTFGAIGVVVLLVMTSYCLYRRRHRSKGKTTNQIKTFTLANISTNLKSKGGRSELQIGSLLKMILDPDSQMTIYGLLLHPDKLQTMWMVGKGAFGKVYQGIYRPDDNPTNAQEVAVKTLKENCVYPEISAFMEEAIVMADFRHVNVLSIIGVCIDRKTDVPSLVLPFMRHGDLQKYLRGFRYDDNIKSRTPELPQLLSFCLHIARGMAYLANMKFVHRDLAARNCMLNGEMVVKVADFGLTRDIYSNSYYRQDKNKLLPIKWMALESLQDRVFTPETDVWSYGVTAWEIFTLGKVPYPNLENFRVLPELERGERLPKPDACPDAMYDLILRCWAANPKDRPGFNDICQTVESALAGLCDYLDLDSTNAVDFTVGVISPSESENKHLHPEPYDDYRDPSLGR